MSQVADCLNRIADRARWTDTVEGQILQSAIRQLTWHGCKDRDAVERGLRNLCAKLVDNAEVLALCIQAADAIRDSHPVVLSKLAYELTPGASQVDWLTDTVKDKAERVLAHPVGALWARQYTGHRERFEWNVYASSIDLHVYQTVFSFSELIQIWISAGVTSSVSKWIEEEHPFLEKLRHSIWHFRSQQPYNTFVERLNQIRALSWPGFEVRLTWVGKWRGDGYSEHTDDLWVDNDFGLLVYVGGKHVLTIGFGVGEDGVFVSQVQLREKKGNRWLYKLGGRHYFDVALDVMQRAFGDVWLVDGESAVAAVRRAYRDNQHCMSDETHARIVALYNRPLASFDREGDLERREGRSYRRLRLREAQTKAA